MAISSCITLTGMLQWGVRQSAEVENLMTSVERVMEYSNLEEEAAVSIPEQDPPDTWPSQGVVEFKDLQLRNKVKTKIRVDTRENRKKNFHS